VNSRIPEEEEEEEEVELAHFVIFYG